MLNYQLRFLRYDIQYIITQLYPTWSKQPNPKLLREEMAAAES